MRWGRVPQSLLRIRHAADLAKPPFVFLPGSKILADEFYSSQVAGYGGLGFSVHLGAGAVVVRYTCPQIGLDRLFILYERWIEELDRTPARSLHSARKWDFPQDCGLRLTKWVSVGSWIGSGDRRRRGFSFTDAPDTGRDLARLSCTSRFAYTLPCH